MKISGLVPLASPKINSAYIATYKLRLFIPILHVVWVKHNVILVLSVIATLFVRYI